ncbi:hypothetical protein [Halobacillus yeomjeoni]|uniref:Uncharacterized protein n=1 Tax=Halobacillus yeomjeoni TaxID=311194 RepID=A0A931HX58_9BACI|nr:hypothetical protein [Halobacillus yeomjeoni]MBH0231199.1 hypothetical protein [Halobacillus yeomjeoni]
METRHTHRPASQLLAILCGVMIALFIAISFITKNFNYSIASILTVGVIYGCFFIQSAKPKPVPVYKKESH